MKLSELNTGESGVIVKVSGHGGFRKRIIEMGFIKGKKVDVLLNAPLQDPVKYKIMGYEVSLRHSEADHIEVVSVNEAKKDKQLKHADEEEREQVINSQAVDSEDSDEQALGDKMLVAEQEADRLHHVINVALIGNPNCGKTTLFNALTGSHQYVGNWPGVTVEKREAIFDVNDAQITLIDLPGAYSLTPYSIEERVTAIEKVLESMKHYEQELSKMRKDADARDRQQKEIRVRAAKTKAEYDAVKLEYDKEYADDTVKLKNLRARAEAEEKKTDPADLEKYKSIKAHVTPPMAKMMNNQCSGCFMALPLGTLRDLKSGEHMVTCDNCGRILYAKDE